MTPLTLEGHGGTTVTIDVCDACHAFWFDTYESLRLSPGATLALFTRIGERSSGSKPAVPPVLRCPRCALRLLPTKDRQRDTPFDYWRCDRGHGRFITFFNFLREKDFIKPLSRGELEELKRHVQTVNCSNCGGPIDLARADGCPHCGSPLSILDMQQARRLIEQLRHAAVPKGIDPELPLNLLRARRESDAAFGDEQGSWWREVSSQGLVESGLAALARWLGDRH